MSSIDVLVPCFNYGRYLRECVGSVLAQEGVDVRLLILDDCSRDNSEEVGRALSTEDSRVTYQRHEKNLGHIANYNFGLEWARAEYVLLLSADDLLTQGALARATGLMESHPEIGMTFGEIIRTESPDFAAVPSPPTYEAEITPGPEFIERSCRECSNLVETATAVVRTSVHKLVGGYRKELPHAGDLEVWLRCASVSSIGRIKAPQGFYRRHNTNMSCGYVSRKDYDQVKAAFGYFFRECGQRVPDRGRLEGLVDQGLAIQAFYLANDAFDAGNAAVCKDLLQEARSLWPDVRRCRGWSRLKIKRALGCWLWSKLRSMTRSTRGC